MVSQSADADRLVAGLIARASGRRGDVSLLRDAYLHLKAYEARQAPNRAASALIQAASRDGRRLTRERPAREYATGAPC
jgi:hypothetical protein